jgi:hypothetical protein
MAPPIEYHAKLDWKDLPMPYDLDELEPRLLLSFARLSNNVLVVRGTPRAPNQIIVRLDPKDINKVELHLNGVVTRYTLTDVQAVRIIGGHMNDLLAVNERLNDFPARVTIAGGDGNDTIVGGSGHNILIGGNGDDIITGGGGDNLIVGGRGNNQIFGGGPGTSDLYGGPGNNLIQGGSGFNIIFAGGNGNDTLIGGPTRDEIFGYGGVDSINGGNGDDTIYGGGNPDTIIHGGTGGNEIHANIYPHLSTIVDSIIPADILDGTGY